MRRLPWTARFTIAASSRGFTVPEMLAVVAIIVIIISLLLPSLQNSREVARNVICMTQQRQIGLAILNFATEHSGNLPGCYLPPWSGEEPHKRSWMGKEAWPGVSYEGAIVPYVGGSGGSSLSDNNLATGLSAEARAAAKLYRCPSLPTGPTFGGYVGSNGFFDYTGFLSWPGAKKSRIPGSAEWTDPGTGLKHAAATPLIVEEDPAHYVNGCCIEPGHSNIDAIGTWHFGGGNYIAIDAHSARIQPTGPLGPDTHQWSAKAPSGAIVTLNAHGSGFGGWNSR